MDNVLPVLTVAAAAVTGIGIPGVEGAFNGALTILKMIDVCASLSSPP